MEEQSAPITSWSIGHLFFNCELQNCHSLIVKRSLWLYIIYLWTKAASFSCRATVWLFNVFFVCVHVVSSRGKHTICWNYRDSISGTKKKKTQQKKRESASTVIITIDHYDFSDSSCCFRNVTISPMRLVMSMVIILDVTAVSVTAKHGLHRVLLLFFPFFFSPCDVLYPT